jgi:diguanylate cyclase (GGDEF)-like protein
MLAENRPVILLASHEPDPVLKAVKPALFASGTRIEIVSTAQAALDAIAGPVPLQLVLLDARLPGMEVTELLVCVRAGMRGLRFPIVLIVEAITDEWISRLREGVIDDLVLQNADTAQWRLRLELVARDYHRICELEQLRETAAMNAQFDSLTGVYNRAALLSMLFRETDRLHRSKSELCLILFDIDDFGHWNSRLGTEICDELLRQVAKRSTRVQRSYDLLGRVGKDEFLMALPGCSPSNALTLAERVRREVFCAPYRIAGEVVRLSACFGISSSNGRTPVVVLHEAEQALQQARQAGPESIHNFDDDLGSPASEVTFLSPMTGDEIVVW